VTALRLNGVHKRYGDLSALADVDLEIDRGEIVALLGPNGAGKTTTFELLLGLTRPSAGHVQVLGEPPGPRTRHRVGVMLQSAGLPEHTTVAELVHMIARSYPAMLPIEVVLERVGLTPHARRPVTALSGGERQRTLLAIAVAAVPDVLLLDEPTAALDVAARRAFWEHVRASVEGGATILFATHDLAEADAIADRVIVLQAGRLIADATPAELKQTVASTVVQVTTDAPPDALRGLPEIERIQVDDNGMSGDVVDVRRLQLFTADAERTLSNLIGAGYRAIDLRVTDAALEDAFLHLTSNNRPTNEPEPSR
jgi:ABC-2 type transport system ATP-binding protein